MMGIKRFGNFHLFTRWYKKGAWSVFPALIIWKDGIAFVWMRLTLKVVWSKMAKSEKGGNV